MAASKKNTRSKKTQGNQRTASRAQSNKQKREAIIKKESLRREVMLWMIVAISLLLFISNFGFGGRVGGTVSSFIFGLFGIIAYVIPVLLLVGSFFMISNRGNRVAVVKIISVIFFVLFFCLLMDLILIGDRILDPVKIFHYCMKNKTGGGFFGGILFYVLYNAFGIAGTCIVDIIVLIVCLVLTTERPVIGGMKKGGKKMLDSARESRLQHELERREYLEEEDPGKEKKPMDLEGKGKRRRRIEHKVTGVARDTKIHPESSTSDGFNELQPFPDTANDMEISEEKITRLSSEEELPPLEPLYAEWMEDPLQEAKDMNGDQEASIEVRRQAEFADIPAAQKEVHRLTSDHSPEPENRTGASEASSRKTRPGEEQIQEGISEVAREIDSHEIKNYVFPPLKLLRPGNRKKAGNTQAHLRETANKLQQTLKTFGVNVTITNISCGPSVTRYEIQPEMGVKVSKIVSLADDIRLNLAAADIRMEAPIPGKAAIGIEVPNKENVTVSFRELIESEEFQQADSKVTFAVGRDIGGKVKVADIAKMPHLLIAGATGSGKSVCINTIIMSVLYKADPNEVKLIMIDPKVVELSVYNGIPHLMIPVVTDPKKAAGALNWAVAEMSDRYQRFAEANVRKIDEYNAKVDKITVPEGQEKPKRMPQILIIVDELADLMMVASHDVEDAICRLAQLARAAGIHLVIATQRPSVNVITGLIKANMPSRIAFAVSSGVDSRTILDMNGAEKLLGKGDMLFNPQGIPKPIRVQGAFVSDEEVSEVVSFIKEQNGAAQYSNDIQQKMDSLETSNNTTVAISDPDAGGDGKDSYFYEAAKVIVDKEKASIGMLQRYLKIGFNRAARIMDQLEEAGIVGPEEGTKPRKVLMNEEEFQQFIDGNAEK